MSQEIQCAPVPFKEEAFGTSAALPKISDRRLNQASNESSTYRSPSLESALLSNIKLEQQLSAATPKEKLRQFLSTTSVTSTVLPLAGQQQHLHDSQSILSYQQIGFGSCGTILEETGTGRALKFALNPNSEALWNDATSHYTIAEAIESTSSSVCVPQFHYFVGKTDEAWWNNHSEDFPHNLRAPTYVLCTERILPLPQVIRDSLINEYCPASNRAEAKIFPSNRDCLARLYLGKRRNPARRQSVLFTLRNFQLHLDQLLDLELDVDHYAIVIADALAVIHWAAKLDANDVEFVLGSAPITRSGKVLSAAEFRMLPKSKSTYQKDFKRGTIHIWLLDFHRCNPMGMNFEGVEAAVKAFFCNDPYYPRPLAANTRDQKLWKTFRDAYLARSLSIVGNDTRNSSTMKGLPERFLERVVVEQQKRLDGRGRSVVDTTAQ